MTNEIVKYAINVKYEVDYEWFNSPSNVLDHNLLCARIDKMIESHKMKNQEKIGDSFVGEFSLISLIDKSELKKYFDGHSTSAEKYTIK
jgi:hypothetical protein